MSGYTVEFGGHSLRFRDSLAFFSFSAVTIVFRDWLFMCRGTSFLATLLKIRASLFDGSLDTFGFGICESRRLIAVSFFAGFGLLDSR